MPRLTSYLFARLNVTANFDDKKAFLLKGLQQTITVHSREFKWGFFDVQSLEFHQQDFITGFLVKFQDSGPQEVVDHADHTITTASVPNKIIAKSRFFIHVKSGLIAFNALADIPKAVFFNRFVEIFKESYQNFMVEAVIYSIDEEYKFYETIKTFNTIEKIKINLHPSNPRFRHKWKDIDERMKRMNVANYSESFQTNPRDGSINIDDEILESKILMADDGYGEARVTGTVNDRSVTISTSDNPISQRIATDVVEPRSILSGLYARITDIFNRFK